jgi:hypothetical protein
MEQLLSNDELNRIIHVVDRRTSLFKTCNVFVPDILEAFLLLENTEYLKKTSASLTELVKTKVSSDDGTANVFLKMWFSWNNIDASVKMKRLNLLYRSYPDLSNRVFGDERKFASDIVNDTMTTSLDYEARVYQYITENIILRNISPNFIPLLTNNQCSLDTIIHSMNEFDIFKRKPELLEKLTTLNHVFPTLPLNFIMTGSAESVVSAIEFFRNLKSLKISISESEYSSIMFQFFYALYVMDEFKIVHNDNHMNNVLIQTLPNDVTFDITIGPLNVQFTTRYVVKFFDWDRAYCQGVGPNTINSKFFISRNVGEFVRGRDFSAFVCFLYARNVPGFTKILNSIIDGPKPTPESNTEKDVIVKNGVTGLLREWMNDHPENIVTSYSGKTYITIPKKDLETKVFTTITTTYLRTKLGKDQFGASIYDGPNVTNIYLGVDGNNLIILKGFTCHPMYDSRDLDVVRYFTDGRKFTQLCNGLNNIPTDTIYKYAITVSHTQSSSEHMHESSSSVNESSSAYVSSSAHVGTVETVPDDTIKTIYLSFSDEIDQQDMSLVESETLELTTDENFLNFAYDVLVKVMDNVLQKVEYPTIEIVLPVVKTALDYIFEVLHRYLTVDNIVEILKISSYLVFQLGKLSYEAATILVVNTLTPYMDILGDKTYNLLSYIFNNKNKDVFYISVRRLLGDERVERFREYIKDNEISFLDIPSSIKRAFKRSLYKRTPLFGGITKRQKQSKRILRSK